MKRKDILTAIGLFVGITMIFLGIYANGGIGGIATFYDSASILIVFGGVIGALLINFGFKDLKMTFKVFKEAFFQNDHDLRNLIDLFVKLSERARREGLLALENELENVDDPFIKKGILLAIDGIEPEVIHDIMNAEIAAMEERHEKGRAILTKAGEYSPAWGMIGTLIGLVLMLNNLSNPETIGPSMAVALLTTFYGTLLANLIFHPMAGKLENKTNDEIFMKQIIIEGVIGVQSGQNPNILREKLGAFLSDEQKRVNETAEQEVAGETVNEI